MADMEKLNSADKDLPAGVRAILAHTGKARSLLCDEPMRNVTHEGVAGFELRVNLTSYRSLPLSCIEGLQLKVDGEEMNVATALLTLNGVSHKFTDLSGLSKVWWSILEPATVFVARATPLAPGEHKVDATLITVEPYVTAGRFSFYHPTSKVLSVYR